jgi:hypothetical protein
MIGQIRLQRGVDRQCAGIAEHQHIAVGCSLGDHVGGNDAAGARHVLDHERLAQALGEPVSQEPRQHVGIAARSRGRDQAHRSCRKRLLLRRSGRCYDERDPQ